MKSDPLAKFLKRLERVKRSDPNFPDEFCSLDQPLRRITYFCVGHCVGRFIGRLLLARDLGFERLNSRSTGDQRDERPTPFESRRIAAMRAWAVLT
jgi:hypothetical protein